MKKVMKLLLVIILAMPLCVDALSNYKTSVNIANNHLGNKYSQFNYNRYFKFGKNVPFVYEGSAVSHNNDFTAGGFISRTEFNISKDSAGKSYLSNGLEYWTATENNAGGRYVVNADTIIERSDNETSGVKVTALINSGVSVNGKGTYADPYEFSKGYVVAVGSKQPEYGQVTTATSYQYVAEGGDVSVKYTLTPGYKYSKNNCGTKLVKVVNTNEFSVRDVKEDINCLLEFEPRVYTISLNSTNVVTQGLPNTLYIKYGVGVYSDAALTTKVTDLVVKPAKTGYTYLNISVKHGDRDYVIVDGNGKVLVDTIINIPFDNDTNNAVVNVRPNTFKVAFNANNGTGSMNTITCTYDQDCVLPTSTFDRTGYNFSGWALNSTATAKDYDDSGKANNLSAVDGATVTLYSVWKGKTYKVNYNANGGSVSPASSNVTYGSAVGTLATPTRSGYRFLGWYNSSTGGSQYTASTVYSVVGDTNLYARWEYDYNTLSMKVVGDDICKPDADGYCTVATYVKYGTKTFVLYRKTAEGYKAIYNTADANQYWTQKNTCCNNGNCTYYNTNLSSSGNVIYSYLSSFASSLPSASTKLVNATWYTGPYNNVTSRSTIALIGFMDYNEFTTIQNKSRNFVLAGYNGYFYSANPESTTNSYAYMRTLYYNNGSYSSSNVMTNSSSAARPVIVFKDTTILGSGTGSSASPFVVK